MVILNTMVGDEEHTHDHDDDERPTRDYETDDCGCQQDRKHSNDALNPEDSYLASDLTSSSALSCTGLPISEHHRNSCPNHRQLLTDNSGNVKLSSASTSNNPDDGLMIEVISTAKYKDKVQEKPCKHCEYLKGIRIKNREKHCCVDGEPSTSKPMMTHYDVPRRSRNWNKPSFQCDSEERCKKNEKYISFEDKPSCNIKTRNETDDCFKIIQKTLAQMETRAQENKLTDNKLSSKLSIVNNCIRNVSLTSIPSSSQLAEQINNMPEEAIKTLYADHCIRNEILESRPRNDFYSEKVTVAVLDWLNKIPIYQGQNGCKLSCKKEIIMRLIYNLLKLSKHINECDYENLLVFTIEKCLESLPLWYPAERRDVVEYKNKIIGDLLETIKNINNKLLRQKFRECCVHVATENEIMNRFYLKAYHSTKHNKSENRKRILETSRSNKHKDTRKFLESDKKTEKNMCIKYETEKTLREKIYNWFDEVQRIDNNRIRNEVTNIILNHLKPLLSPENICPTKRRDSIYKLLHTIFKELPITVCCTKNKTMDLKKVAQELTDRLIASQRFLNSTKYVYQTSNVSLFEPSEPKPAKKDRILAEVNHYFEQIEIEADEESIEAIVSILYEQQNRINTEEVQTELMEALQNIDISEELVTNCLDKFRDIVRTTADESSAEVAVEEEVEEEDANKKYIRCNYGITRNLTDCLQKYLNIYFNSDRFARDAVTKRMVTEFEKLEYDESSVDDERITPSTFQKKIDIVREVSEWLTSIPLEKTFNAPTNNNRAILVTEMAEDIFDVLESFSSDELNDLIDLWMPELPVLQTHSEQLETMRSSLVFRLEKIKQNTRTRHAIVSEVADRKSDVRLFQDFVDPYIVVKQALGDDVATQAAMIHQLAHALKDVRDFQMARRLMTGAERNQSVRRFSMELEFIKHITDWLKHIPTKKVDKEVDRKERLALISDLAEYLGKAKDSNLEHPIPETEITNHVKSFLAKVIVHTLSEDNYMSYISDLKDRVKWNEKPATEPQGFPSQSGVPAQDRSAELRKHYLSTDTDYGTFSEHVPRSSSREVIDIPYVPEEVKIETAVSRWVNELGYRGNDEIMVKSDIQKQLIEKINNLNNNKEVYNNAPLYSVVLEQKAIELLNDLPPYEQLAQDKSSIRTKLVPDVTSALDNIKNAAPTSRGASSTMKSPGPHRSGMSQTQVGQTARHEQSLIPINTPSQSIPIQRARTPPDALTEQVQLWASRLGIEGDQNAAQVDISNKLLRNIEEMNMNPSIYHDEATYADLLEQSALDLLEQLPFYHDLERDQQSVRSTLVPGVLKALSMKKDSSAGSAYKSHLEEVIGSVIPKQNTPEKNAEKELLKSIIAENHILNEYDTSRSQESQANKSMQVEAMIHEAVQDGVLPARPIDEIYAEIIHEISKLQSPKEDSIRECVEEIKSKDEISHWLDNLPIPQPASAQEALYREQLKTQLAQRLRDIQRKDPTPDQKMQDEISIFLSKLQFNPGPAQNNLMTADLISRLKATTPIRPFGPHRQSSLSPYNRPQLDRTLSQGVPQHSTLGHSPQRQHSVRINEPTSPHIQPHRPTAFPRGSPQPEHNMSSRSVRSSPNQPNAPITANDTIVPNADFNFYSQSNRQRSLNVSQGAARPDQHAPPCTSPCAILNTSQGSRRDVPNFSHGPQGIADRLHSSNEPHTTSLFVDQPKNCIDLLYDVIEDWCQSLPLEGVTKQEEIRNSDIKAQMELRLVLQISEINRDDIIFEDQYAYDERLNYVITDFLNALPTSPTLENSKPALKEHLKQSISTLRPAIQKDRDRYRFKQHLHITVERETQRNYDLSPEMRAQMDVICEEIVDDFIEYTYANNKAKLKSKVMQTIEKAFVNTTSPRENAKRLFAALSQINAPIFNSIYCEIGEIRMKREIAIWLKRIPQIDANPVQMTIRDKIKSVLAKKLYGLESGQATENNEHKMRLAIYKALKKMGVEEANDQLVEELLVRLRNSKIQRYQHDPIIIEEIPSYASSFDRQLPQLGSPLQPRLQSPVNTYQRSILESGPTEMGPQNLQTSSPGIPLAPILAQSPRRTWQPPITAIAPGVAPDPTICGDICQTSQVIPVMLNSPAPIPQTTSPYIPVPPPMPPAISAPYYQGPKNPATVPASIPPPALQVTSPSHVRPLAPVPRSVLNPENPPKELLNRSLQLPRLDVPPDRRSATWNLDEEYRRETFSFSTPNPNDRGIRPAEVGAPRKIAPAKKYDAANGKGTILQMQDKKKTNNPCKCPKDNGGRPCMAMPPYYLPPPMYMQPTMPPPPPMYPPYGMYYYQ